MDHIIARFGDDVNVIKEKDWLCRGCEHPASPLYQSDAGPLGMSGDPTQQGRSRMFGLQDHEALDGLIDIAHVASVWERSAQQREYLYEVLKCVIFYNRCEIFSHIHSCVLILQFG